MYQEVTGLEQRLTDLQAQLEQLSTTLHRWRDEQERISPAETRLDELAHAVRELVEQWHGATDRQARVVGSFEERVAAFSDAEQRLHQDTADRLRHLEQQIEQEWHTLRQMHEVPLRELRDRAETLTQVSIAAGSSAAAGIERTEARLAQMEAGLHQHLADLSRQIEAAVSEGRALPQQAATAAGDAAPQAWPIEGVVRLHDQLRQSGTAPAPQGSTVPVVIDTSAPLVALPIPAELTARIDSLEQALAAHREEAARQAPRDQGADESHASRRMGLMALTVLIIVIVAAGVAGGILQRQTREAVVRASEAEQRAQAAAVQASERVSALEKESAREVAEARADAARAQAVTDILASPDLIRFAISGGQNGIAGQVLWSRTRGVVFSGVRLPPAPERMTYQLWLLTDTVPVNAGIFAPDASGRVTFSAEAPRVPRPVIGAALTLEPAGGSQTPSDRLLGQNRPPRPAL